MILWSQLVFNSKTEDLHLTIAQVINHIFILNQLEALIIVYSIILTHHKLKVWAEFTWISYQ